VKVTDSFREKMTQNPSTASNSKQSPPVLQLVRISIVQRCHYFLHPTPDTLASSLRADSFLALCQNAGFAGYWFIASAAYRPCLLHPSNFCLPPYIVATAAQRKLKIGAEAHQNIAPRADQKKNCCRVSPEYCCEKLPRENRHRISPKYCCQSLLEKWLPNLTKNVATRAAQRELLPKLTKILLSKPSREN